MPCRRRTSGDQRELGPVHMAGDVTTLTVGSTTLRLTRVEFAMLRLLLVRYGFAVSRGYHRQVHRLGSELSALAA